MKRDYKRVLIISDLHCGHDLGLTPPDWHYSTAKKSIDDSLTLKRKNVLAAKRKELWKYYAGWIKALSPIDVCIANGDLVDGRGERAGSIEQFVLDREEQVEMAVKVLKYINAREYFLTYGTAYHVGATEDWERMVCNEMTRPAQIESHPQIDVEGHIFDVKHDISGSQIPHGRHTASARERMWNVFWAEDEGVMAKADYLIRSHVHYYSFCGSRDWFACTTPGLQGLGSRYGTRKCSGIVHFGLLWFDIPKKIRGKKQGGVVWPEAHILKGRANRSHVLRAK